MHSGTDEGTSWLLPSSSAMPHGFVASYGDGLPEPTGSVVAQMHAEVVAHTARPNISATTRPRLEVTAGSNTGTELLFGALLSFLQHKGKLRQLLLEGSALLYPFETRKRFKPSFRQANSLTVVHQMNRAVAPIDRGP